MHTNGLQMGNDYNGLDHRCPSEELYHISQVVYAYSDCLERFLYHPRLDEEARMCAVMARSYGLIPLSLATLWWRAVGEA